MKKLITQEYDDNGRIYVFDDGSRYYSVTTMIGNTSDKQFLDDWRRRIGIKKAEAITKYAGVIGTQMHESLEDYLNSKNVVYPNSVVKNLAQQIIPYIDKRINKVYGTEKILYSDKFKLAGTVDGIVSYMINNTHIPTIIDFKTAKKQPKIEWIQNYCLQMALYGIMIEEMFNKKINYGVLLFAYKEIRSPRKEVVIELDRYREDIKRRIEMFFNKI